jgi:predicted unusual protein kinase regulating ubiquinone biosynthesis (AarF/ABC1/UbiB family)
VGERTGAFGVIGVKRLDSWSRHNRIWRSYRLASLLLRTLFTINRERTRVLHARARGEFDARPNVEALLRILREFRRTAVDMGGLLIKLGQFLASRADLLPPEALAELAMLHDELPPERFEAIAALVEHELGAPLGELFTAFDPRPAGSASLGQVHRARLRDGRVIAIKVQRPGISSIVRTDLNTLRFVLGVVRWLAPAADRIIDLRALYREFSRTVYEELDYEREGQNAERFGRLFAEDERILAPAVIWERTTRRVLALEWMEGIKITRVAELDAAGVNRHALAKQLANAYFKQVFEAGFFHADPHPGNILVQPCHDGARMVFVDFGMIGIITPRIKAALRDSFGGVARQDAARVVRGLDAMGFLSEEADRDQLEHLVGLMLTRFSALPFGQLRNMNRHEVMGDLETVLYDQPLRLPTQLAFFGRALSMLLGLTVSLSPEFNFAEVAAPYARQFLSSGGNTLLGLLGVDSVEALGLEVLREGIMMWRSLIAMPHRLDRVLARAERGDMHFILESADLNPRHRRRTGRRIARGLLNQPVPVWVPLGLLGGIAASQMLRRRGRRQG